MRHYCNISHSTTLQWTPIEVNIYMRHPESLSFGNVLDQQIFIQSSVPFSIGSVGGNVNLMLKFQVAIFVYWHD